jgi:UDP-N-acetylglucosamine 2-epimerase
MLTILTIVGARPQFIKAAPLSEQLRRQFKEILVHTGQHYDQNMSDIFFTELDIPRPDFNLGVGSGSHGHQTAEMLAGIEDIINQTKPDLVLVYGDTNTTLAGALAASKLLIPVAHVEAGLRSFDKAMPEEQNRILTDHLSSLLFCPTETAVTNLKNENIRQGVSLSGDIMYDSVLRNLAVAERKTSIQDFLNNHIPNLASSQYNLITIHRAENTNDPSRFQRIMAAINQLPDPSLMPVHPRVASMLDKATYPNITFIPPVGYLEMLLLTKNATRVITDSGGLQKEAWFLETQCLTIRSSTEWVETLANGCNILVPEPEHLRNYYHKPCDWSKKTAAFGDGNSASHITHKIREAFK